MSFFLSGTLAACPVLASGDGSPFPGCSFPTGWLCSDGLLGAWEVGLLPPPPPTGHTCWEEGPFYLPLAPAQTQLGIPCDDLCSGASLPSWGSALFPGRMWAASPMEVGLRQRMRDRS